MFGVHIHSSVQDCATVNWVTAGAAGAEGLTEGVVELPDSQGEAAVGALDAEEDHGDILGGASGGGGSSGGGAVVGVALVHRQLVVQPAGELLSLQNPAVKHLPEEEDVKKVEFKQLVCLLATKTRNIVCQFLVASTDT